MQTNLWSQKIVSGWLPPEVATGLLVADHFPELGKWCARVGKADCRPCRAWSMPLMHQDAEWAKADVWGVDIGRCDHEGSQKRGDSWYECRL